MSWTSFDFDRGMTPEEKEWIVALAVSDTNLFVGGIVNTGVWRRSLLETPPALPDRPANLMVVAGDRRLNLAWSASATPNVLYRLYRSTEAATGFLPVIDSIAATSVADTGLVNGTTYFYTVRAFDPQSGLESDSSNIASGRPRSEAAGVAVRPADGSQGAVTVSPNPLTSYGTVRYRLDGRTTVSITLFDALGRTVASPVVDEIQEGGEHEVSLAVEDLLPGVYLCRLSGGNAELFVTVVVVR
jgi:hypothetical protein